MPPRRLAREDVQFDRDERPGLRIEDAVRVRGADEPVTAVCARRAEHRDLGVLREVVVDLAIAGLHLDAHALGIEHVAAGERLHPGDEVVQAVAHDEVRARCP